MNYKILSLLKIGYHTKESLINATRFSEKKVEEVLEGLIKDEIIQRVGNGYYIIEEEEEITPKQKNDKGDNMNNKKTIKPMKNNKKLNCTSEQREFAQLVQRNKGILFDENKVFIHRGAEVLFGGAGNKALRYKIAVSGFSDKEEIEYAILYLDWDDSALYEEGGLADQIREVIVGNKPEPTITPTIQANS